jgi:hypothetical protein
VQELLKPANTSERTGRGLAFVTGLLITLACFAFVFSVLAYLIPLFLAWEPSSRFRMLLPALAVLMPALGLIRYYRKHPANARPLAAIKTTRRKT